MHGRLRYRAGFKKCDLRHFWCTIRAHTLTVGGALLEDVAVFSLPFFRVLLFLGGFERFWVVVFPCGGMLVGEREQMDIVELLLDSDVVLVVLIPALDRGFLFFFLPRAASFDFLDLGRLVLTSFVQFDKLALLPQLDAVDASEGGFGVPPPREDDHLLAEGEHGGWRTFAATSGTPETFSWT